MLFNVEGDTGDRIFGYCVPDGVSGSLSLSLRIDGQQPQTILADRPKPSLVEGRRHETGRCGFDIIEADFPGLAVGADVEIRDSKSGFLFYRRAKPEFICKKICRIETQLHPLWGLDRFLRPAFQYYADGAERLGRETVTQLFLLDNVQSLYVSGRILFRNYSVYLDHGFEVCLFARPPYLELAERLIVLALSKKSGAATLGDRDAMVFAPAIEFSAGLPFANENAMKKAIRAMPSEVATVLANPLVRLLTSSTPDELPIAGAVSAALDALSSFKFVGVRGEGARGNRRDMIGDFADIVGIPRDDVPRPRVAPGTLKLAKMLKDSGAVEGMLEKDLELFYYVCAADQQSGGVRKTP